MPPLTACRWDRFRSVFRHFFSLENPSGSVIRYFYRVSGLNKLQLPLKLGLDADLITPV